MFDAVLPKPCKIYFSVISLNNARSHFWIEILS
jgi:hypothetical protein